MKARRSNPVLRALLAVLRAPFEFQRRQGPIWAASLAYHTILALLPLSIIVFSFLGAFQKMFNLEEGLERILINQGLPQAAERAGQQIQEIVDKVQKSSTGLGVVGFAFLVISGMSLFSALEGACNHLWGITRKRTALARFRALWLVVTLGPLLAGLSLYATVALDRVVVGEGFWAGVLAPLAPLLPFILTWCAFLVVTGFVPNTRVRVSSALLGALVAGTAWEFAKRFFNTFVANAHQMDRLYGALAILPLFVIWLHITWSLALLGVQIAQGHQDGGRVRPEAMGETTEARALAFCIAIAKDFRDGKKPRGRDALARRLGLGSAEAQRIVEALLAARILTREDQGGLMLARAAEKITAAQVVEALDGRFRGLEDHPELEAWLEELSGQRLQALEERSLADCLG